MEVSNEILEYKVAIIALLILIGFVIYTIATGNKQNQISEPISPENGKEGKTEKTEEIKSIHPEAIAFNQKVENLNAFLEENRDKSDMEIQLTQLFLAQENTKKLEAIRSNSAVLVNFQVFYLIIIIILFIVLLLQISDMNNRSSRGYYGQNISPSVKHFEPFDLVDEMILQ